MSETMQYTRFRWAILFVAATSVVCAMMITMSLAPLVGEISGALKIDVGAASFAFLGLPMLVLAAGIGLSGFLIDRLGVFPVVISSQLLIVLATASIAFFGDNYAALLLIRIVQGIGGAGLIAAFTPALALWFPPHELGRVISFQGIAVPVGLMLGLNGGPQLSRVFGSWRFGVSALSLVVLIVLLISLPVAIIARRLRPGGLQRENKESADSMQILFRMPAFWLGMAVVALAFWVSSVFSNLTPGFLAVASPVGAGFGPQSAGSLMSVVTLATVAAAPLAGFLVDKVFRGRDLVVILIGWVLTAVAFLLIALPSVYGNRFALISALLIAGCANPFVVVTIMAFAGKVFPSNLIGRACGFWMSIAFFAGSAGVMVESLALHATGNYRLSMITTGMCGILGLLISLALKEPAPKHTGTAVAGGACAAPVCQSDAK
jgi:MFS family permease